MKATFALLPPIEIQNLVHQLAWEAHTYEQVSTLAAQLPAHVSLKITFNVDDLDVLASYMDELAAVTPPVEISLTDLQLIEVGETGILWLDMVQTPTLRQIHNRILTDLEALLGRDPRAGADGIAYHFHMTVAMGEPLEAFQSAYAMMQPRAINTQFTAHELALFVYDDQGGTGEWYITYKILPLSGKPENG